MCKYKVIECHWKPLVMLIGFRDTMQEVKELAKRWNAKSWFWCEIWCVPLNKEQNGYDMAKRIFISNYVK